MKLRPKFVSYMLIIASVPLVLAMSVALWQGSSQTHALTIDIVQGYLDAGAGKLSGFFGAQKSAPMRIPLCSRVWTFSPSAPSLLTI